MFKRGFSLVELVVVIALTMLFILLAIPSFYNIRQNNNAVALTNSVAGSLNYARAEAVKRGTPVTICASANTSQTACGTSANWTNGWIIFEDTDNDGVLDAGEDVLRVGGVLELGTTFGTAIDFVTFDSTGFVFSGAGNFNLAADGCKGNYARILSVSTTGRVSIASSACP